MESGKAMTRRVRIPSLQPIKERWEALSFLGGFTITVVVCQLTDPRLCSTTKLHPPLAMRKVLSVLDTVSTRELVCLKTVAKLFVSIKFLSPKAICRRLMTLDTCTIWVKAQG